jgi:anti-sigma factor RsiW
MKCDELLPFHGAYFDSELDTQTALAIQQHLAACPKCARAFAAEAKLETRIAASLKQGQHTAALWKQIEQQVVLAAESESGITSASRAPQQPMWWRELFWPSPRAWAGLAALWVAMLAVTLLTREPAALTEARRAASPSPQLKQILKQQRQMLAELGGVADPAGAERDRSIVPQPRSQRQTQLINT